MNDFTVEEDNQGELLKVDQALEEQQKKKLAAVRAERNQTAAKVAIDKVEATARNGGNLMPVIVDAVRVYATLGEISDAMRKVFGEYRAPSFL